MKQFIFRSFLFLGIAVGISIAIFVYLNTLTVTPPISTNENLTVATSSPDESGTTTARETPLPSIIPPAGFPLRMLPLSETQKKVLTASGIDIETFMITPEMITCGEQKIGKERMFAISEGSAPSVIEVTKLLPCLSV